MSASDAAQVRREFLAWDRPLLSRAVAWLAEGWDGSSPLDLNATLLVVPTRQSGRRLRAALAEFAAERSQAVLPPRVVLPEQILELAAPAGMLPAGRAAVLLGWVRVLLEADLAGLRAVFPADPRRRDFAWALALAEDFTRLQDSLAEGLARFANVASRAGDGFPERERWEQLGNLEDAFDAVLGTYGLVAPAAVAKASARAPAPPPNGVRRVVLLATPDPRLAALEVLAAWSRTIEIVVLVFGAPEDGARFDAWGRPLADAWAEARLELPEFESRVRVAVDGGAQAEAVAHRARGYAAHPGSLAIGCADAEIEPLLASALKAEGLIPFRPEGESIGQHSLAGLLETLHGAATDDGWDALAALCRRAEILDWLARKGASIRSSPFLAGLDEMQASHLPPSANEGLRHAADMSVKSRFSGLAEALGQVAELAASLRTGAFPEAWNAALAKIFAGHVLDPAQAAGRAFLDAAAAWSEVAAAVTAASGPDFAAHDAAALALRLLSAKRVYGDKPQEAVEIDGWLELPFRDEPHLVVAGLNDGAVPESVTGHAFLPESLRVRLGLKTNGQRLARDAWLLAALAASRPAPGRVDLWLARSSDAGDPLRPSRLLFLCADADLPRRTAHLFRAIPAAGANIPWTRAWRLRPPASEPVRKLSVTAFRDYLACPFRFYLKHGLGTEAVDAGKRELDPRDFGRLLHRVLERLGRDEDWRDCTDERVLAEAFACELDRCVSAAFGRDLSLPLLVQIESARQRLAQAAGVQAAERAAGWVIRHTEWRFPQGRLTLGGIPVSGTIDRIEQNEVTGDWRVLDYKTAENAESPADAHIRGVRRNESVGTILPEAVIEGGKKPSVWKDLQLPLYRWAVRETLGTETAAIGYFNLPKAVSETAVTPWDDYDAALHEAALRCAAAVAGAVAARRFSPPAEEVRNDDFGALFHAGAAASIDWP